mmetsp:Transcript_28935/g.47384  ORF Transcript_28935/g.47384 Transcript_28935/m.47384 type:complete len:211 (-) Transcript_28935:125-757(-)
MNDTLLLEHTIREVVANGDTFQFSKLMTQCDYDISKGDSVYSTLLHTAVQYGQIEMMRLLTEYGLEINVRSNELTLCNTPLHDAVNKNNRQMVDVILELNADINAQNNLGLTPLALAALKGHTEIALFLLSKNSDPDIEDYEGKTPYIHAKENNVHSLLDHLPEKKWCLDSDPKWKALVEAKLKEKENGDTKKGGKKDAKNGKKKKGKKK